MTGGRLWMRTGAVVGGDTFGTGAVVGGEVVAGADAAGAPAGEEDAEAPVPGVAPLADEALELVRVGADDEVVDGALREEALEVLDPVDGGAIAPDEEAVACPGNALAT